MGKLVNKLVTLGHKIEIPGAHLGQQVTWGTVGAQSGQKQLGHSWGTVGAKKDLENSFGKLNTFVTSLIITK